VKTYRGLADVALVPRRGRSLVNEGNPSGVQFSLPDIEIHRGNVHLGANGLFDVAYEHLFQPGNLPPNKSAARSGKEDQNDQHSQNDTNGRTTHTLD
jgi:hypothetical protein